MKYIDLYLLPVPVAKFDDYVKQAQTFGDILVECGGLGYGEFKIDQSDEGKSTFYKLIEVKDDEILTSARAEFKTKAHRDEVMAKVMADPRIKTMLDLPAIADMTRMTYCGFEQFVGA